MIGLGKDMNFMHVMEYIAIDYDSLIMDVMEERMNLEDALKVLSDILNAVEPTIPDAVFDRVLNEFIGDIDYYRAHLA